MDHLSSRKHQLALLALLAWLTPARPAAAASPPDGYVLWQSDRLDARHEIYRSRGDGSEVTRMTQTGGLLPLWSPDGRWIAFHDDANTGYLMRPDGSERKTLAGATPWFWLHDNSGVAVTLAGLWQVLDPETLETTILIRPEEFPQFASGASFVVSSITHDNRYLLAGTSLYINGYTGANGSFTSDFSAVIIDLFHKDKTYYFGSGCWPITSPAGDLVFHVCADCPTHPDLYHMHLADLATRSSYAAEVAHQDADWGHEYNPRVSNDNQWLAYMASTGCHEGECDYDIWLHQIGTAPSERLRITQDPAFDGYPHLFVGPLWQKTSQPRLLLTPSKLTFFASAGLGPAAQTVKVKNAGGGTLGALTVTADPAAPWLDVAYDGASSIAFSVRGEAVRRGTWQATVTVAADGALDSPVRVPVTLNADESFPAPDAGTSGIVVVDAGAPGEAGATTVIDGGVVDAPVVPVVDAPFANTSVDALWPDGYVQGVPAFDAAMGGAVEAGTAPANSSGGCGCAVGAPTRASSAMSLLIVALVIGAIRRRRLPRAT